MTAASKAFAPAPHLMIYIPGGLELKVILYFLFYIKYRNHRFFNDLKPITATPHREFEDFVNNSWVDYSQPDHGSIG